MNATLEARLDKTAGIRGEMMTRPRRVKANLVLAIMALAGFFGVATPLPSPTARRHLRS